MSAMKTKHPLSRPTATISRSPALRAIRGYSSGYLGRALRMSSPTDRFPARTVRWACVKLPSGSRIPSGENGSLPPFSLDMEFMNRTAFCSRRIAHRARAAESNSR